MPNLPKTKPKPTSSLRAVAALSTTLVAVSGALANCPDVTAADANARPSTRAPGSTRVSSDLAGSDIKLQVDSLDASRSGAWRLNGDVTISQGDRQLKTRDATYDPDAETFATDNDVEYSDPTVTVRGSGARFDPAAGADFSEAQFQLSGEPGQAGRGVANRISVTQQRRLSLDDVRYTTCPLGNDDWVIRASDIDISQQAGFGIGRNVRLDFKGVPILYTPFISFPVGNERKSGFLFPDFGTSSRSGTSLVVPWYWNIAPNYDATFSPTWYSRRGGKLDTEFRYLTAFGRGVFSGEYLPDDRLFGESRSLVHFTDQSEFARHLRLDVDAANASDSQWFEDFGLGPEGTSISYLNRLANVSYLNEHWFASVRAQNFQTIDYTIEDADRPYTLLPQLAVRGLFPRQPYGLTFGVDGELSNFQRDNGVTGTRIDLAPEIRMPLRSAGIYLEPAVSWRYTAYNLEFDDPAPGASEPGSDDPRRSAPVLSVDGGMTLERTAGSKGQRLQTLEPRFMYLYVPYRDQNDLPVFDTNAADLNLVQLFRTNRYVGADRLSNANQVSVGVTSRLFDADTGQQFIAATVGQAYYFDAPKVGLPGETLTDTESSDIIAELNVSAYRDWNVRMGLQWDPDDTRSEKGDLHFQYRPAHDRVMNVGYRFRRNTIEQVDGSVAWPLGERWSAYARMVYSLEDETSLDQFAGLEYRSCCWRLRFVSRRYVSNRNSDVDTSFLLQLELNGLSSVGVAADAFLERSIRGYSSRPPQP